MHSALNLHKPIILLLLITTPMEYYSRMKTLRTNQWGLFYQLPSNKKQIWVCSHFLSFLLSLIKPCSFILPLIIRFNHLAIIPCNLGHHIIALTYLTLYLSTTSFVTTTTFNLICPHHFSKNSTSSPSKSENALRKKSTKRKNVLISITPVTGEDVRSNSIIHSMNVPAKIASFTTAALWCITK